MPLPLSQYMAAVQAAMQPAEAIDIDQGQTIMPPETITPQGLAPQAPIAPSAPAYQPGNPFAGQAPPPAASPSKFMAPDAFAPTNPIEAGVKIAQQRGDLPVDAPAPSAAPTQADPGVQAPEHPFPLMAATGGGVVPAHEVDLRGPTLRGAQGQYNDAVGQAIQAHTLGGAENAGREFAMALEAERGAQARQMAAEQAMAEREEEMLQKQHDFAQSAKALGQFAFKPDGGFWESRMTGQKIAGVFELAMNGFLAGTGRPVPSQVMMGIERSIRAQENAYHAARDGVNAQQTAFSMAMQKYNNLDAARSHVRVAALEGLQAQAMQVAALNKGNETGMRAMAAIADLEGQKMQQIAQGIRFLPAQAVGRRFVDQNTGLVYTEQEAKGLAKDWYANAAKREEIGMNTAGDLLKEGVKAGHQATKDARGLFVPPVTVGSTQIPGYSAATVDEAKGDREAREAGAALVDMIDQVLAKRDKAGYAGRAGAAMSPINAQWENDVSALAPQIGVAWSKTKKLGTYDKGVENLIKEIQGSPTAVGTSTDDKLRQLRGQVMNGLAVAKETQTGESRKPATLKTYGGK
jgi:hypothetical protein